VIAIVAVADRGIVRAGIENRFVRDFSAGGQDSTATYELLSELTDAAKAGRASGWEEPPPGACDPVKGAPS